MSYVYQHLTNVFERVLCSHCKYLTDGVLKALEVVFYQSFMLEVFLSYDADNGEDLADFLEQEDGIIIEPDHRVALLIKRLVIHLLSQSVDARHVNHDIDHVAAKFIALHVHGGGVSGHVYFGHNIKQKGFLYLGIGDEHIEKVLQGRQLRYKLLNNFGERFEY